MRQIKQCRAWRFAQTMPSGDARDEARCITQRRR
jgi:hypothetical protein